MLGSSSLFYLHGQWTMASFLCLACNSKLNNFESASEFQTRVLKVRARRFLDFSLPLKNSLKNLPHVAICLLDQDWTNSGLVPPGSGPRQLCTHSWYPVEQISPTINERSLSSTHGQGHRYQFSNPITLTFFLLPWH